jgi:M6 family metalloprotease-like protein
MREACGSDSSSARARSGALLILLAVALGGCTPAVLPLGPSAVRFRGSTLNQNKFDKLDTARCPTAQGPNAGGPGGGGDPPLNVFSVIVDTNDHRFPGTQAQATAYRDAKRADYESNANAFWQEASFGNVSVTLKMYDRVLPMAGAFDDYFNRTFVPASLASQGLAAAFPLTVPAGTKVTFSVRDGHGRNVDVDFAPTGVFADANALVPLCQTAFNGAPGVPSPWVTCSNAGGELFLQLDHLETAEGSFIRVKGVSGTFPGFDGPIEAPGNGAQASLVGKSAPGPILLAGTEHVILEVRDKDFRTRRYDVALGAGPLANGSSLASRLLPKLNSEFNWVETGSAGADRLALRVKAANSGPNAAIRIVGGTDLAKLGLDGPVRVDGVIDEAGTNTVRGDWTKTVAEALSLYVKQRAADLGIPVDAAHQGNLDTLVQNELAGFDSYLVLFIEQMTGLPGRRAGASGGYYDLSVPGSGGFTYQKQLNARLMIGEGAEPWVTWAHEMGHNLGFWDLYRQPDYDTHYDPTFDYLDAWSIMANSSVPNHPESWHKHNISWIVNPAVINPPASGATHTDTFTLTPVEYPFAPGFTTDYALLGTPGAPATPLIQVWLSANHFIHIENRQPGPSFSQVLPDDTFGWSPAHPGSEAGGVLVTDTVDPNAPFFYRAAVTAMNPDGSGAPPSGTLQARALKTGDTLDLKTVYPAYDGIKVSVDAKVPGPPGKPEALKVSVTRGPGDFLDLEIRPWHAPDVYATPDIWVDWPGNGSEDYPTSDPPLGSGDLPHWDPDGKVLNYVKVRVHNRGTILGKGVVVRAFHNEPIGMGDHGTFQPFPNSAPQDIPAGEFRDFRFEWFPTKTGHTCLRADIFTHDSALGDLDPTNNSAQENIDEFAPQAGSPYTPLPFDFKLTNGYDHPVEVELVPSNLADGMDVELETAFVKLGPKEERVLKGRLFVDVAKIPPAPKGRRKCDYHFNLHAFRRTRDSILPFGGVTVNVTPSYGSTLELKEIGRDATAVGPTLIVRGVLKGPFNVGQKVDVAVVGSDGVSHGGIATTGPGGSFTAPVAGVPKGPARLLGYYFGPDMTPSSAGPKSVTVPGP